MSEDEEIYIPDPIELMEARNERMWDLYIDEYTCMACGKKVDYDLMCMGPMGDGPAVCYECSGLPETKEGGRDE